MNTCSSSSNAKNVVGLRPAGATSFQLASTTHGTSTATSARSTSAMPSTPSAKCTPKEEIQLLEKANWNRGPRGSKAAPATIATTSTTSDVPSVTALASPSARRGSSATTTEPASGTSSRISRYGELIVRPPPGHGAWVAMGASCEPHHQQGRDHEDGAGEHGQRVGADE